MLQSPEQRFSRLEAQAAGLLGVHDFERIVRDEDRSLTPADVQVLWRIGQGDRRAGVELHEVCLGLHAAHLEVERSQQQGQPLAREARDRVVEVKMVQLARWLDSMGFNLEKSLLLFDPGQTGFLDRPGLQQLLQRAGFGLADWELDEVIAQCDTYMDGRLSHRELVRRLSNGGRAALTAGRHMGAAGSPQQQRYNAAQFQAQSPDRSRQVGGGAMGGMGGQPDRYGSQQQLGQQQQQPWQQQQQQQFGQQQQQFGQQQQQWHQQQPMGQQHHAQHQQQYGLQGQQQVQPMAAAMTPSLQVVVDRLRAATARSSPEQVFRKGDMLFSGELNMDQLERLLLMEIGNVSREDVQGLYQLLASGTGKVRQQEFCALFQSGP